MIYITLMVSYSIARNFRISVHIGVLEELSDVHLCK